MSEDQRVPLLLLLLESGEEDGNDVFNDNDAYSLIILDNNFNETTKKKSIILKVPHVHLTDTSYRLKIKINGVDN